MRNIPEITVTKGFAWILSLIASGAAMGGDPALPGHHPLSQIQAGSLLMAELRCAACHKGVPPDPRFEKTAPDLTEVGVRIAPEYLRSFLASPFEVHPGTTMPDMLVSKSEAERRTIAEALTHYLVAQSSPVEASIPTAEIDRQLGKELFHSIGCVACHGPKEIPPESPQVAGRDAEDEEITDPVRAARREVKPSTVGLNHVTAKYSVRALSEFLFQPLKVRRSGRMPDMKLTPKESLAIAGYLVGDPSPISKPLVPKAELVAEGKRYFQALNCGACHALPGSQAIPSVGSLQNADLTRGCLSITAENSSDSRPRGDSPRFDLNVNQLSAIAAAIQAGQIEDSDRDLLAKTLTAFRCVHCHVRDDYGGVHDAHNAFFKGSQLNLGDDGRIPPPLTWMGAKLKSTWMKKVLFDGESVRHYMATRMPQYGADNLADLPELFGRLDTLSGPDFKLPNPQRQSESERQHEKLIRAAGRELLGDKGANCVACHTFNRKAASVNQGIDLLTTYERLQPAWFHSYLQKPGAFRPRTVMPTAWPDGVAAFTAILDGDTDRQIEAIWYYLSLGTSAADPSGVRSESTKLEVGDQAVIHRGRSRVAGFRGIAVGLPEKLNYAFNAETGTLSAIWEGEFIHVNWSGQGSGEFNPVSQPVLLAQDVSFAGLADENARWPLLPVMTKEAPTNPNPLYPKNVGYQFRGYFLDDSLVPTFLYRSGSLDIEDRTAAEGKDSRSKLTRVLTFRAPTSQTIWFRALVGDIRRESEQVFQSDRLRVTIPVANPRLRRLPDESMRSELLLRLEIPEGKTQIELEYELLSK